jgi:Bacterial Ig domain/Putative Ig domain/FG-GAP-like repeat
VLPSARCSLLSSGLAPFVRCRIPPRDSPGAYGTPALGSSQLGPYSVTVMAEDGTYATTQTLNWTITSPITITTPADQTNNEGDSVSLSISAADSVSGSTKIYAALGLPTGLVINPTSGAITGTIAAGASANGPYSVTIAVGDGTYNSETTVTWNVNSPITFTNPPTGPTNNVGDTVSVSAAATDSISGSTLTYSVTGLPAGLSLNTSTGAISGTLTQGGSWQATVTATDGTYSNTTGIGWTVNGDIAITDQGDQSNAIGNSISVQISATDIATGTLTISASGLPTGLSISSSTGLITGTVGSGASTTTPYTATITVTDGTHTSIDVFNWFINPSGAIVVANPGSLTNYSGDAVDLQMQASDSANGTVMYVASNLPAGLSINHDTGEIFGTVASSAVSGTPYSVTVSASDGSNTGSATLAWTISAAVGTISSINPGNQTSTEGTTISTVSINASDSTSGATMHYMAYGLPPGLKINTSTGAITGTVAIGAGYEGPYTVIVVANDGTNSAAQTFNWNINSPISFNHLADQTNNENDSVSVAISAADSTGGTVTYAAQGLPPGLAINPSTGAITGTVARGAAAFGPYSVIVTAQDANYSKQMGFNWNVNSPVAITAPADQTNNESDSVSFSVSATDAISGSTVVFSALGLPGGLSINSSTGVISGTVAVGDSTIGSYSPTIMANDSAYYSTQTFNWTVNSAVTFNNPGDQTNTVGDTINLLVNAADASSGTLTYAAAGLPNGLSINTTTGAITGTISSGAASIGSFVTTVFAGDGTYSSSDTFNWTIAASGTVTLATPSNQSGTEGNAITTVSLSATDSTSGATLHYFAQNLPPGLVINPANGQITGTPALGAAAYGPVGVIVIATDGTNFAQESFLWTISDPVAFSAVAANQTNTEGDTPTPSFAATDASSGTLKYTADGLPPGLSINTGTGAISGTVALGASAVGTYQVTVTANDSSYSASEFLTWTITNPITLTALATQDNMEGDSVSLSLSASDASSGTLKFTAVGLPPGLHINSTTGAITGTIAVGAGTFGPYSVTVAASDNTYGASQTFTWNIGAVVPPASYTTPENTALTEDATDGLLKGAVAPAGTPLTVSLGTGPSHGTLSLGSDGSFTYTPTTSWYGTDTFTVDVSDGASNSLTVTESFQVQQDLAQSNNDFRSVATGDFNGDGNQDFVVANYTTDAISIFFGNGAGAFPTSPTVISVGNGPDALAVGNFGNGYEDIAVANSTDGTVTILMNNGSGSFSTSQTLTVGTNPVSLVLGDFEGNGHLDLAVANKGSNTVSVFLYSGSGTFTLDTTLTVGASPSSVAAADLSNNGYADLVVANSGSNTISVLMSNGNGTFATAVNYAVGSSPSALVAADFNGDGNIDVAVTHSGSNTVSVLMGNDDGALNAVTNYRVGSNPFALAVGNITGDGFADIAVVNHGSNNESILANDGTGMFTLSQTISLGESPDSVAVADFKNNGVTYEVIDAEPRIGPRPNAEEPINLQVPNLESQGMIKLPNPGVKFTIDGVKYTGRISIFTNSTYTNMTNAFQMSFTLADGGRIPDARNFHWVQFGVYYVFEGLPDAPLKEVLGKTREVDFGGDKSVDYALYHQSGTANRFIDNLSGENDRRRTIYYDRTGIAPKTAASFSLLDAPTISNISDGLGVLNFTTFLVHDNVVLYQINWFLLTEYKNGKLVDKTYGVFLKSDPPKAPGKMPRVVERSLQSWISDITNGTGPTSAKGYELPTWFQDTKEFYRGLKGRKEGGGELTMDYSPNPYVGLWEILSPM